MKDCKPVSEIDKDDASPLGDIIEGIIRDDYCKSKGGCQAFPAGQDFFDDRTFGNQQLFIAFLKSNNPQLAQSELLVLLAQQKEMFQVPDICIHQPPRFEIYEIKPTSPKGLREGIAKLSRVGAFCDSYGLPYVPGTRYKPDKTIQLETVPTPMMDIEVSIHVFWKQPGLILYEICTELVLKQPQPIGDPVNNNWWVPALVVLAIIVAAGVTGPVMPWKPVPAPG